MVLNFDNIGMPVPEKVYSYCEEIQKDIYDYLTSLTDHEKKAYTIACQHLGTSMDILRSNGFHSWKANRDKK